jgi:hypothetical protein
MIKDILKRKEIGIGRELDILENPVKLACFF